MGYIRYKPQSENVTIVGGSFDKRASLECLPQLHSTLFRRLRICCFGFLVISALIPSCEAARLDALRRCAILDTPPEERFDRLTRWAARHFNVPIALISMVDQNRQWYKACVGMSPADVNRKISFCAHAIHADDVFVIPDTLQDERFCDNPLVVGAPFIRFYAGAPLITSEGFRLGTMCLVDTAPRKFRRKHEADLQEFAATAVDMLEARRAAAPMNSVVQQTASGVIICDPHEPGNPITFTNSSFCMMSGYSRQEIISRSYNFLNGSNTDKAMVDKMQTALAKRETFQGTMLNYRKDGTAFWSSLSMTPVFDDFGELISFVIVQVETTAPH